MAPATITCCGVGVVQSGLMLTLTLTGSGEAPGVGMSVLMLTAARGEKSDHGRWTEYVEGRCEKCWAWNWPSVSSSARQRWSGSTP